MPSDAQDSAIQSIQTIFGSASLIASIMMAEKLYHEVNTNLFTRMLGSLCCINIALSVAFTIGRAGTVNNSFCQFQGLIIQWFSTASMLWVILLSYQMHQWVVLKKHPKRMEKIIKRSIVSIFLFSGLISFVLLGLHAYDRTFLWCWIAVDKPVYRIIFFEIILLASWLISLIVLRLVTQSVAERIQSSRLNNNINTMLGQNGYSVEKKLSLYIGSFIFIWFFALLNRTVEYGLGHVCYPTAVLQAIFLSSQGLINTLLYGNVFDWKKLYRVEEWLVLMGVPLPHHSTMQENVVEHRPASGKSLAQSIQKIRYTPKQYSIFISTLNMGEAGLETFYGDVKDWIVEGHDIYAIGLQECIELPGLRELILNHLGGPTKYTMYTTSIGSGNTSLGYHGYIALTVFVKNTEVEAGHIFATKPAAEAAATGTDLIITTAQNKGAVGIALHIHDTSIGFVTCHLPSDSKGKSKLTKRNASAHAILKQVILAPEDLGFDLHLQHDHVFVFGDLNYRMETTGAGGGVNSLTGVAVACTIEKQTLNDDPNWLARKYNLLRHHSDLLYPSLEEVKLIKDALHGSRGAWSSVLRADELRSIMDDGDAFCGFEEPMPCFPPSYKRRKGKAEGSCGDYTDFSAIVKGYSNTGEIENMLANNTNSSNNKVLVSTIEKVQNFINRPKSSKLSVSEIQNLQRQLNQPSQGVRKSRSHSNGSAGEQRDSIGNIKNSDEELGNERENEQDIEAGGKTDGERAEGGSRRQKRKAVVATTSTAEVTAPKKELDPSKLRPPSYTDRILIHSLPERQERVTVQAYDFCDIVRASDHRAVSMTVLLEVNSSVLFNTEKTNMEYQENSKNGKESYKESKEPRFELFEVFVGDLQVTLYDLQEVMEDEEDDDEEAVYRDSFAPDEGIYVYNKEKSLGEENPMRVSLTRTGAGTEAVGLKGEMKRLTGEESPQRKKKGGGVKFVEEAEEKESSGTRTPPMELELTSPSSSIDQEIIIAEKEEALSSSSTPPKSVPSLKRGASRRKSLFSFFSAPEEAPAEPTPDLNLEKEKEQALIKELSKENMDWKNKLHKPNEWRKKKLEEQRRLKAMKEQNSLIHNDHKTSLRMKKSKKSDDKNIYSVTIVFPLPSKDPLLAHRKMYDYAHVFEGSTTTQIIKSPLHPTNHSHSEMEENMNISKEELLRPLSVFAWQSSSSALTNSTEGVTSPLQPPPSRASLSTSSMNDVAGNNKYAGRTQTIFNTAMQYKVKGCASVELGAHILLKLSNKAGYEFGSSVISVTQLLHDDSKTLYSSHIKEIPLTAGGQKRGHLSAKFSIRYIPSLLSTNLHSSAGDLRNNSNNV